MCLAIPMKIIDITDNRATADVGGVQYQAYLDLISDAKVGDYIIVHAGFAIEKLNEAEARESLAIWREIAQVTEERRKNRN